jgi:hypothetical protein
MRLPSLRLLWHVAAAAVLLALAACSSSPNATAEYDLKYPRIYGGPN